MTFKVTAPLKFEGRKSRNPDSPYLVFTAGDWTWRVLKTYGADNTKLAARWHCAVESPFTRGTWDMGDVYVWDIVKEANADLIAVDGHVPTEAEMASWLALRAAVKDPHTNW